MKMLLLLILTGLVGCVSGPQRIELSHQHKKTIKTIAVVEVKNQDKYKNIPGEMPGGFMFYSLGPVGTLALAGVEISKINSAEEKFTKTLSHHKLQLNSDLANMISSGLEKKGYIIKRIKPLPLKDDGKTPDYSKIKEAADAILTASVMASYQPVKDVYQPHVVGTAKMVNKTTEQTIYQKDLLYGNAASEKFISIPVDDKFKLSNYDSVYSNDNIVVDAFHAATSKIAERVLADF